MYPRGVSPRGSPTRSRGVLISLQDLEYGERVSLDSHVIWLKGLQRWKVTSKHPFVAPMIASNATRVSPRIAEDAVFKELKTLCAIPPLGLSAAEP